MATLTVTDKGQVTLGREVLQHLGIQPGEKMELDLLPDGRGLLRAARPARSIHTFIGMLAGPAHRVVSIEEMNEAAGSGWAGKK
jgi:bifunctional DNA-binding transcriptional regulator/antitoxin component of YhaV-PrlF toxin-antitoxin module